MARLNIYKFRCIPELKILRKFIFYFKKWKIIKSIIFFFVLINREVDKNVDMI
jgi:hypothetical protein